jgi:hypothetical protein
MRNFLLQISVVFIAAIILAGCSDSTEPSGTGENFLKTGNYWILEYTERDDNGDLDYSTTETDSAYIGESFEKNGFEYYRMYMGETPYSNLRFEGKQLIVDMENMFESEMGSGESFPFEMPFDSAFFAKLPPAVLADFETVKFQNWDLIEIDTSISIDIQGFPLTMTFEMKIENENIGTQKFRVGNESITATGFRMTTEMEITVPIFPKISSVNSTVYYMDYEKGFININDEGGESTMPAGMSGETETETTYGALTKLLRYRVVN